MFDANLLFSNAAVLTVTANSAELDLRGTAADGVDVEVAVTAASGTGPTLDPVVQHSDTSGSGFAALTTFAQITATGRATRRVQSDKRFLRIAYTVGGTSPSFTVTAGIVSGKPTDQVDRSVVP